MTPSKPPTRRRNPSRRLRMAQNPHYRPNRRPPHGLLGEDSPLTAAMRYKRRQSEPKNQYFQRKRRRIDDVCNNHTRIPTKTPRIDDVCNKTQAGPPNRRPPRGLRGQAAVPVGGGGAWPGFEATHKHTSAHRAPLVWRAPEGPEGTGGLRGAAPNEVRTPSLAGGRGLRRPEHQRGHTATPHQRAGRRPPAHTAARPSKHNEAARPHRGRATHASGR